LISLGLKTIGYAYKGLKSLARYPSFLRLGLNYLAYKVGSFILLIALKSTLRAYVYLLKEALEILLGFILYINSIKAFIALEKHS
jgi:hypothetical protein